MGWGTAFLIWVLLGTALGIVMFLSLSAWVFNPKTPGGRLGAAAMSILVAAIIAAGFATFYPSPDNGGGSSPDKPNAAANFKTVFGRNPPSGVEIVYSDSTKDDDSVWTVVQMRITRDELEDLVSGWDPGSVDAEKLPNENWSLGDCQDERAYLNKPDWDRDEYSAVLYCGDYDTAEAFYRKTE